MQPQAEIRVEREPKSAYNFGTIGTLWETMRANEDPEYPYFPFCSRVEYELADYLASHQLTQQDIDDFLNLSFVSLRIYFSGQALTFFVSRFEVPDLGLSFRTAEALYDIIESKLPHGPQWERTTITLEDAPNEPQTLYYRNIEECALFLAGNPTFRGKMDYEPWHIFMWNQGHSVRVYNEMSTGDIWREHQVRTAQCPFEMSFSPAIPIRQRNAPEGTTLLPLIFGSDKCHLTAHTGNRYAWPVYMSLANIKKETRNKPTCHAWLLVAMLPVTKFPDTHFEGKTVQGKMPGILRRLLFHRCLKIVLRPLHVEHRHILIGADAEGEKRRFFLILIAWLADIEEQWLLAGLAQTSCPRCMSCESQFGDHICMDRRTGDSIVQALRDLREEWPDASLYRFAGKASAEGYAGVEPGDLFWVGLGIDICQVICVDMLHGLHKFVHDHVLTWIQETIGVHQLDRRLQAQIHQIGKRTFGSGISHISQMAGRENRELERHLFVAIVGAETDDGNDIDPRFFRAMRALFNFICRAQFREHTDDTLDAMRADLATFHSVKQVLLDLGARVSEVGGNCLDHLNIPKLHMLLEYPSNIIELGAPNGFGTEVTESLHRSTCHATFALTNNKGYEVQMLRAHVRQEALSQVENYYKWRRRTDADSDLVDDGAGSDSLDSPLDSKSGRRPRVGLTLAKRSHALACLDDAVATLCIPGLPGSIIRYLNSGDSGTTNRSRYLYQNATDPSLPTEAHCLALWWSAGLTLPPLDQFHSLDRSRLHCKYDPVNGMSSFSTILVETNGNAGSPDRRASL